MHTLVTDAATQQITAKIDFTGTPIKKFQDVDATGRIVRYSELEFYWLDEGKIARVESLVDWKTYRKQLVGT